jgi:hypothetical protein
VLLTAGTYTETISPASSGAPQQHITYKNHGSDQVVITGVRGAYLKNRSRPLLHPAAVAPHRASSVVRALVQIPAAVPLQHPARPTEGLRGRACTHLSGPGHFLLRNALMLSMLSMSRGRAVGGWPLAAASGLQEDGPHANRSRRLRGGSTRDPSRSQEPSRSVRDGDYQHTPVRPAWRAPARG